MKKLIIIFFVIVIIIITIVLFTVFKTKNIKIGNIKRFRFSYSVGYHINGSYAYEINIVDGKYEASIKKDGVAEEDAKKVIITNNDVKKVEEVLKKYNVSAWNGFNKVDKNVLDGNSFGLYVTFKDDSNIDASGYMRWPKNYGEVRGEFDSIFNEFYER